MQSSFTNNLDSIFIKHEDGYHVFGNLKINNNIVEFSRGPPIDVINLPNRQIKLSVTVTENQHIDLPVIIYGDLSITNCSIFTSTPKLEVHGNCYAYNSPHKSMPNHVVVFDTFIINCSEEAHFPHELYTNKLNVSNCTEIFFPKQFPIIKSLTISDNCKFSDLNLDLSEIKELFIQNTKIMEIGRLLHLSKLNISQSKLTRLPESLRSVVTLDISNTEISSIPDQAAVGTLYASDSKLEKLPKPLNNVFGYIDVRNCPITELPEGLTLKGGLDISGTFIKRLPKQLSIDGILNISRTGITYIDESLSGEVSEIIAEETPLDLDDVPERLKSKLQHTQPLPAKIIEMERKNHLGKRQS